MAASNTSSTEVILLRLALNRSIAIRVLNRTMPRRDRFLFPCGHRFQTGIADRRDIGDRILWLLVHYQRFQEIVNTRVDALTDLPLHEDLSGWLPLFLLLLSLEGFAVPPSEKPKT